ncbi:MAG: signal peptide peptidase SppA [Bacteroidota bacterium]
MKSFLKTLFASILGSLIGFVLLIFIGIGIIAAIVSGVSDNKVTVKDHTTLLINISNAIPERNSKNPISSAALMGESAPGTGLTEMLEAIEYAKTDEHIKGILIETGITPNSFAVLQELRDALLKFRKSGKYVYAYGEMMDSRSYFLCSAADKIYVHPTGEMLFNGISSSTPYIKNMLDKVGVEIQLIRYGKYKSAGEPLISDKMSDANRDQISAYTRSRVETSYRQIAKSRKLSMEKVDELAGELRVQKIADAVEAGLIDSLKYRDELEEELKALNKSDSKKELVTLSIGQYVSAMDKEVKEKDKIAIIYANGEIMSGEGDEETMGSDDMVKAFKKARKDSTIKAVVLRINSPGGSALASDVIWREVVLTEKVKPVIVSMGGLAASGGYYIAAPARKIVAQPNTITGSIGVFGMIPNAQKLMNEKLGVRIEKVNQGKYADLMSIDRPLREDERAIIQKMIDRIYDDFITKVAEGRKITKEQVDEIAQGRVWTGKDALAIHLVDTLGGLNTALAIAAKEAKITGYRTVSLPVQKDPITQLIKQLQGGAETYLLKKELGESYQNYAALKRALRYRGIQAMFELPVY